MLWNLDPTNRNNFLHATLICILSKDSNLNPVIWYLWTTFSRKQSKVHVNNPWMIREKKCEIKLLTNSAIYCRFEPRKKSSFIPPVRKRLQQFALFRSPRINLRSRFCINMDPVQSNIVLYVVLRSAQKKRG